MGNRLALLVATYEYSDSGLRQLTSPARDAEALAAVLSDAEVAGFQVTTLVNEPHYRVGEAISRLYQDRRRDDLTLLYFSCHGLKDDDGRLYLATTNTKRDSLLFTSLPAEQIDQAMSSGTSHQRVLILDCCYGGAFPDGGTGAFPVGGAKGDTEVNSLDRFRGRGRTVLTATDSTQYAFEGDSPQGQPQPSVFTRYLVQGLREGSADLDGDGDITLDELYTYVHDRVVEERPNQRPKRQDNVEGRIVVARNVNWRLPQHLRHAIDSPIPEQRRVGLDGLAHLARIGNASVRAQVLETLAAHLDDDSRLVSSAARDKLRQLEPGFAAGPEPGPSGRMPGAAQPVEAVTTAVPPAPVTDAVSVPTPPGPTGRLRREARWRRTRVLAAAAAAVALIVVAVVVFVLVSRGPAATSAQGLSAVTQETGLVVKATVPGSAHASLCQVASVGAGTPGNAAKLKAGDVVTSLAGVQVQDCLSVEAELRELSPGDRVGVGYLRGGKSETSAITLAGSSKTGQGYLGIEIESGSSGSAGCQVAQVVLEGPAFDAGVRAGDEIKALAGIPVSNCTSLEFISRQLRPNDHVMVEYYDKPNVRNGNVTLSTKPAATATLSPSVAPNPFFLTTANP
jgi:hypothetical protein